jgi:hypothetical protein
METPSRIHETAPALGGTRPRHAGGSWPGAAAASAAAARGRELGAGWREFGGKLVAYYLVRLRVQPRALRGERDLASLVAETYRRDPRHTAFLLERLCYDYVMGLWRGGRAGPGGRAGRAGRAGDIPRHLLDGEAAAALPEQSLILLHAGLGMALTEILLLPLASDSPASAFAAALDSFAAQVEANARPEFAPVAFEALGLMVRRFIPRLHAPLEACLRARDERLAAYYWHGAGRAIYFLPSLFHPFPGTARRGVEICRREPLDPRHRLDALAGFCFASTMINLRHPEVVARLLPHLGPDEIEALASGVAAALLTRHHTSPDEPGVRTFLRPLAADLAGRGAGPAADLPAGLWENAVRRPCAEALDRAYPLLRARGELATLARHRPLASLPAPEPEE